MLFETSIFGFAFNENEMKIIEIHDGVGDFSLYLKENFRTAMYIALKILQL